MPSSLSLIYQFYHVAQLRYQIMGADLGIRVGQSRNGCLKVLHARIMQNKHVDHLPLSAVVVGGRMVNKIHAEAPMSGVLILEDALATG